MSSAKQPIRRSTRNSRRPETPESSSSSSSSSSSEDSPPARRVQLGSVEGSDGETLRIGDRNRVATDSSDDSRARSLSPLPSVPRQRPAPQKRKEAAVDKSAKRKKQSGVIPNYSDLHSRRDDAERDIVIDERIFDSLLRDTPREFQDANKPPSAPRIPAHKLSEMMTWEAMQVMSELEARTKDWYTMVQLVAGLAQVKASSLIVYVPPEPSTHAEAEDEFVEDTATTAADRALAALSAPETPAREEYMGGPMGAPGIPIVPYVPGPILGRSSIPADAFERAAGTLLPPQTIDQVDSALFAAGQSIFTAIPDLPKSGARFGSLRRERAARAPPTPAYAGTDNSPAAVAKNQRVRVRAAEARTWVASAVATGVYRLSPSYTAARDTAHMLITSRAPRLADVELRFFIRDAATNTAQHRVRIQFAGLIVARYNMARHMANRSAKLATDAQNVARDAEEIIRWFVLRITFDHSTQTFYDAGSNGYGSGRAPPIELPRTKRRDGNPYAFCDPHSPLPLAEAWQQPALYNPLLFTPGTLLNRNFLHFAKETSDFGCS